MENRIKENGMGSKVFVFQFCNRNIISSKKLYWFKGPYLYIFCAMNKMMAISYTYHAYYRALQIFIMNIP